MMDVQRMGNRTTEQIREHYEVEKELASKLLNATREERRTLYSTAYEELYRRVPHHPQLTLKKSGEDTRKAIENQMNLLGGLLHKDVTYIEVGPGDCAVAFEVAKIVKKVYAVDVSETITKTAETPPNFELILSDGFSIPVPANSSNVAYSHQLMEHLHPDDAYEQLKNIFNALAPGGVYFCVTPNRLNGPHDISRHFDRVPTGFHLKEYTITELTTLFKEVGFAKVRMFVGVKGNYIQSPVLPAIILEGFLKILPGKMRMKFGKVRLIRKLLNIKLLGYKGQE